MKIARPSAPRELSPLAQVAINQHLTPAALELIAVQFMTAAAELRRYPLAMEAGHA